MPTPPSSVPKIPMLESVISALRLSGSGTTLLVSAETPTTLSFTANLPVPPACTHICLHILSTLSPRASFSAPEQSILLVRTPRLPAVSGMMGLLLLPDALAQLLRFLLVYRRFPLTSLRMLSQPERVVLERYHLSTISSFSAIRNISEGQSWGFSTEW